MTTSFDFNLATLIPIFLSAALTYAIYRVNRAQDARDARLLRVEDDLNRFKVDIAMTYIRSPEVEALRDEVTALRTEFHALAASVNRLIGRLDAKA